MNQTIRNLLLLFPSGGFRVTDVPQSEGDALIWLFKATNGPNWTDHTNWLQTHTVGNWFGVTVAGGHVTGISPNANNLSGNIGGFPIRNLPLLLAFQLFGNAGLVGNVGSWALPGSMTHIRLDATGVSGDNSGWVIPASMTHLFYHGSSIFGTPNIGSSVALQQWFCLNCALTQANVDAILLSIYNRRMAFTFATPELNIGGTNLAPSGVYGAACPPGTGKEYAFELVNDSCLDGFNKWAVTFTP